MKTTSNLGFAAFLMLKDYKIVKPPEKESGGRFAFFFDISKESLEALWFEYTTSSYQRFDHALVTLKKMLPREPWV